MTKVATPQTAYTAAKRIDKLHKEIVMLRKIVLAYMRTNIKANMELFEQHQCPTAQWMADRVLRGYFGTDVRTEKILRYMELVEGVLADGKEKEKTEGTRSEED